MQGFDQKMYTTWYNTYDMYRRPSKKKEIIRRTLVYSAMTLTVLITVAGLIFVILGYRIDTDNRRVERSALVQYKTIPSGSSVKIDGKDLGIRTPSKSTVIEGTYKFEMQRDGYEVWQKTLDIKAGTLTWLNYSRLVPKNRPVVSLANYPVLHASLGTYEGQAIVLQSDALLPSFRLVDVRSDDIKTTTITLPTTVYSEPATPGVTHSFRMDSWDTGGRYLIVEHTYADKKEWLVVDTHDVNLSKNMSTLLGVDITRVVFSGTSGNILYALTNGDIRKLDLSVGTMSRPLVSGVLSFEIFKTDVITYVGTNPTNQTQRVVGLYREGDVSPHVLRTVSSSTIVPLHITTSQYFNQDYIAISEGGQVDILSGSYPTSSTDTDTNMTKLVSFNMDSNVDQLSFSPTGFYLVAQSGSKLTSYDIEHKLVGTSTIAGDASATAYVKWLDDDHLWSNIGDSLTMRDFDGTNFISINTAAGGHDVMLTQNDRFIYSIGKTTTGYQLQRVRMILP